MTDLLALPDGPRRDSSPTTASDPRSPDQAVPPTRRRAPERRSDRIDVRGSGVERGTPPASVPVESAPARTAGAWGLDRYRQELGWPVSEAEGGVVLQLGGGIGAVDFPAGRGRNVLAQLQARRIPVPVLALPGRQLRWVFLTTPDDAGNDAGHVPLAGARLQNDVTLALPPATTPRGPVRWVVDPTGDPLPRLSVVVAAGWQAVTVR